MTFIILLLVLLVLVVLYFVNTYNGFVSKRNLVDEAFSTMDVYLVKRHDLIPNLVATVKGYATHEAETLEKIISARSMTGTRAEQLSTESEITAQIKNIFAVAEAYPELKANQSFNNLQSSLMGIEDEIAKARKYYNATVRNYNMAIESFPASYIANAKGFLKEPMFEVSNEEQRENVKVEF